MASKGVTKRHFCASVQRTSSRRGMPPRVFCRKSAEVIENKGSACEKERKEKLRVRNRKEAKEIEEVKEIEGEDPARSGLGAYLVWGTGRAAQGRGAKTAPGAPLYFRRNFWARQPSTSAVNIEPSLPTAISCGSKCGPLPGSGPRRMPTTLPSGPIFRMRPAMASAM